MTKCLGGCGKKMPATDGKMWCDACRAKKSRAKRTAVPKAYEMGFTIDGWGKLLSDGTLTPEQGREIVNAVWDRVFELRSQVTRLEAVKRAKAEISAQKKR